MQNSLKIFYPNSSNSNKPLWRVPLCVQATNRRKNLGKKLFLLSVNGKKFHLCIRKTAEQFTEV